MSVQPWSWKGMRPRKGLRSIFSTRFALSEIDWPVALLALMLLSTSLIFIEAMAESDLLFGRERVSFSGHVKKLVVALPFFMLGFLVRPRWLRRQAWVIYALCILLLFLVPIIGEERNHARRWIPIPVGGFDLQPSELAKLGLIVALARALYRSRLQTWAEWGQPLLLASLPMALVAAQPDLGTALTIVPVTLGMGWLAGARPRMLVTFIVGGILASFLAFQGGLVQGYQMKRIETWAACFDDDVLIESKNGAAFHTYQARVAIGHGGLTGQGLGRGVANEAAHLPERECDSIFAVIAEESGFIGASLLILGYLLFSALILISSARVRDRFARLVVGGVGLYFAAHFFINVGVNVGLLPMTGLTLPLISTGGSSLLANFIALGLALGLSARQEPALDMDAFRA
ncbi:MAG: rod shape determining protein RodA [Planctomycetota bacterium]|jgi:rod shape determining protein RodA